MLRVAVVTGAVLLAAFGITYACWYRFHPGGPALIDFSAYYAAGRTWLDGGNPFGRDIWDAEQRVPGVDAARHAVLPFVGPPFGLPWWALFARVPYPSAAAIWGVLMVGAAAIVFATPARIVGRPFTALERVALALIAVVNGPVVTAVVVGQAALPTIAAIDLALLCAIRRRWIGVSAALVVAALLKPNLALVLAGLLVQSGTWLALVAGALVSLAGNVAFALPFGGLAAYLHVLAAQGAAERWYLFQFTPASIAFGFGIPRDVALTIGILVAVFAAVALAVFLARRRPPLADAVALACCAFPFVVPYEHEPDLAILVLPAFLVAFRARGWAWVAGACGVVLVCIDPFALALGPLGRAFAAITACVAALQLAALAPRDVRRLRLLPLALVPLIAVLGCFAPPRNLPMWPDALPPDAVAPSASVNQQWRDELVASGLEHPHAWVALVRALTLLGAAGIGVGLARSASRREDGDAVEDVRVVQAA